MTRTWKSIGGIIGGERSGCTDETVNVFLEAACSIRCAPPRPGASSASSRTPATASSAAVDPAFARTGVEIATRMILELCGGEASELVIAGAVPDVRAASYTLRPDRGSGRWAASMCRWPGRTRILTALGFT